LHGQAGILAVRAKGNSQTDRIRETDRICNHLEDVHGKADALGAPCVHDLVHLRKLEQAAKHDNAEAEALREAEPQARRIRPVYIPH